MMNILVGLYRLWQVVLLIAIIGFSIWALVVVFTPKAAAWIIVGMFVLILAYILGMLERET